jgi:hypothetical protein
MLVFHTTPAAEAILTEGFRDGRGTYMTGRMFTGVWFGDRPMDCNEGAKGDTVLVLDIPEGVLRKYEWCEEGKPYREFLVPARVVNRYGPPKIHDTPYSGMTAAEINDIADGWERHGAPRKAAEMRSAIPFLERHGLLGKPKGRRRRQG